MNGPTLTQKITDNQLTEREIVSAICAHHDRIGETIDHLFSGNITPEALEEVRETSSVISNFAELAMLLWAKRAE